jgi:hypothetical protein
MYDETGADGRRKYTVAQLAAPALDWMHSRGWQLHPQPLCPADHG